MLTAAHELRQLRENRRRPYLSWTDEVGTPAAHFVEREFTASAPNTNWVLPAALAGRRESW